VSHGRHLVFISAVDQSLMFNLERKEIGVPFVTDYLNKTEDENKESTILSLFFLEEYSVLRWFRQVTVCNNKDMNQQKSSGTKNFCKTR